MDLYAKKEMAKMSQYQDKVLKIQQMQQNLPPISRINLGSGGVVKQMDRFMRELGGYAISISTIIQLYESLTERASDDCKNLRTMLRDAPQDADDAQKETIEKSIIATEQLMLLVKTQRGALGEQKQSIIDAQNAIRLAKVQNNTNALAGLLRELYQRDEVIRKLGAKT